MTAAMTAPVEEELWNAAEREAWRAPEKISPSEWAERYRDLPRAQSPRPGPWRNETAPYLRAIMDLPTRPGVAQVSIMKCAQAGASEALRNLIGYFAHLSPDPVGLALPDRAKGRKIVRNRVLPFFRQTPVLKRLLTARAHDLQAEQIALTNGFLLHLLWSGSASALASDPMRLAIADEVDKFLEWTGREADPVSLIEKRLRAFGDRGVAVNLSTPTTRAGKIAQLVEASDVLLYFVVPCPRCGTYQRLVFPQLKWQAVDDADKARRAASVLRRPGAAWYECSHCRGRIEEEERPAMIRAGRWASADGSIADAEAVERWPTGTRIGMQLSALYVLWVPWAKIAAEFIRATGDLAALFDFYTATLGEPFEQEIDHAPAAIFPRLARASTLPEGRLPEWAATLLATVDTQADHFYCVLRAWGPGMRSARVWHGRVQSFDELDDLLLRRPWPFEDDAWAPVLPALVLIDSGGTRLEAGRASRTMEVYRWVLGRQARVRAVKGAAHLRQGTFLWMGRGFLDEGRARRGDPARPHIPLWFLDTGHFADELVESIHAGETEGTERRWFLNQRDDPEYAQHLAAMRKVLVRHGGSVRQEWIVKPAGARHDYWDCESYQFAAAYLAKVHLLPPDEQLREFRRAQRQAGEQAARASAAGPGRGGPDPWKPRPLSL